MSEAYEAGRRTAERSQQPDDTDTAVDLANLSERERSGGWTFRAALVRFAQPEPLRSAVIMECIRRSEAALHPLQRAMADGQLVNLAHAIGSDFDDDQAHDVVAGYRSVAPLSDDQAAAIPLIATVLALDELGDRLARWAPTAPEPGPVAEVDATCHELHRRFEQLAVPVETGPPGPGRGRRR